MKIRQTFLNSQKTPRQRSLEKTLQNMRVCWYADINRQENGNRPYPLINWTGEKR